MANAISTGQITLVDLTDQRTSSFYLQADQSKIQTYDVNKKSYSPDYTKNHVTITPVFFFGNDNYSDKLTSNNLSYKVNGNNVSIYGASATPTADYYQKGSILTIQQNIGVNNINGTAIRVEAFVAEDGIEDSKTGLKNSEEIVATIEFALVTSGQDGGNGISVTNVEQQYITSASATIVPNKTDSGWSPANPTWKEGEYLWIRTKITYSNGKIEYTDPYCDSSWKAAVDGVLQLNERINGVDDLIEALQKEVDGAIETWYLEGDPTATGFVNPWPADDTKDEHIGDLYFDTNTGKSYRYFKKDDGNYVWQIITDSELTQAMQDIQNLQTEVDGKVTIYYDKTEPNLNSVNIDDLWIKPDGNFYQCTGTKNADGTVSNKKWELANITIDTVTIEYAEHTSNVTAPNSGWKPTAPAWSANKYVWQRTVTTFKDNAKQTHYSDPVCISAAAARGITISGEQVFKSTDGTSYLPTNIVLTANTMGGLTIGGWYYKNGNTWTTLNSTASTQSIGYNHAAFLNGAVATIKVQSAEDASYYDIISLYKVTDGQKGEDGKSTSSVFLTNENITFVADEFGKIAATSITCNVVAYTGTTKVTPQVGTISGAVTGMTVTKQTVAGNEVPIKIQIAANATLGGAGAQNGSITVPVNAPVKTNLIITWSKVNVGATGAAGNDAVFAVVESRSGTVFTDSDASDTKIELEAMLYVGGSISTDCTYTWDSIPDGSIQTKPGSPNIAVIQSSDVVNIRTYICTITAKDGKTYSDRITINDKKDTYYIVITSSNGDKFTNGNTNTTLTCHVYGPNGEVDTTGTKYFYTWQKYDVNSETSTTLNSESQKSIEVTPGQIDGKAVFTCAITEK